MGDRSRAEAPSETSVGMLDAVNDRHQEETSSWPGIPMLKAVDGRHGGERKLALICRRRWLHSAWLLARAAFSCPASCLSFLAAWSPLRASAAKCSVLLAWGVALARVITC